MEVKKKTTAKKKAKRRNKPKVDEFGLSPKEREVADLYRAGPDEVRGNGKRCYLKIHPNAKDKSAESMGSRMLRRVKVAAYLKLKGDLATKEADVDALWILNRLKDECTADMADLYHKNGSLKPIHDWPLIWRQGLVAGLEVEQRFITENGTKIPDGYILKIKASDRVKRLEMLGRHTDVQAFKETNIEVGVQVIIEGKDAQA